MAEDGRLLELRDYCGIAARKLFEALMVGEYRPVMPGDVEWLGCFSTESVPDASHLGSVLRERLTWQESVFESLHHILPKLYRTMLSLATTPTQKRRVRAITNDLDRSLSAVEEEERVRLHTLLDHYSQKEQDAGCEEAE